MVAGSRISTFDKYNPFTLKGNAPVVPGRPAVREPARPARWTRPASATACWPRTSRSRPTCCSATFRLRREARFHNGDPVRASDVKHSFDTLISKYAHPSYATLLADVEGCDVLDERTVRFRFRKKDRQLPLVVGGLPVFTAKWGMENGKTKPFDQVDHGHPDRHRALQDRAGPLRQGHHLRARPELLGARPARAPRA